jgi:hypothetical protein
MLLDTLNRHRGKGQQKSTVEQHVHVHSGGQDVVQKPEAQRISMSHHSTFPCPKPDPRALRW